MAKCNLSSFELVMIKFWGLIVFKKSDQKKQQ